MESTLTLKQTEEAVKEFMESLGEDSQQVAGKLKEMGIKGCMGQSASCPLANVIRKEFDLQATVDEVGTAILVDGKLSVFPTPNGCDNFIQDFDTGKYPQLDEHY